MKVMLKEQQDLWAYQNSTTIEQYWTHKRGTGKGRWFSEQLKKFDFKSIYEVGTFSGRNLNILGETFQDIEIGGCDVNNTAIEFAKKKIPNAKIMYESIYELNENVKWDIVFTMGVMIHIPQDGMNTAIKNLISKSNKYVMHFEQVGDNLVVSKPEDDKFIWYPDLEAAYKNLGYKTTRIDLPIGIGSTERDTLIIIEI